MTPEQFNQFYDSLPPGFFTKHDALGIFKIAKRLPKRPGVKVVEVGSLFGRSAICWSEALPDANIFCVDPWIDWKMREENARRMVGYYEGCMTDIYEKFKSHTAQRSNITQLRGHSPQALDVFENESVDCVFIDGVHHNPEVAADIKAAARIVRPGGIVCGHDMNPDFPDIALEVERLAYLWQVEVTKQPFSSVWWVVRNQDA